MTRTADFSLFKEDFFKYFGLNLNSYKERQMERRISNLSRKILHAYEEERLRLARELHDELGMSFSTVKLNLQLLKKNLPEKETELQEKFADLIMLVDDTTAQVRRKAAFMRPPSLHDLGLLAVLENMVNELSQNTGLAVQPALPENRNDLIALNAN